MPFETSSKNLAENNVEQHGNLSLVSPAFRNGEPLPEKYGYTRQNVNPPFQIDGIPSNTQSLVLIMDDPDALKPAGKVWDHWMVWNIPPTVNKIPEGWNPADAVEGTNSYGNTGYGGPNPPDKKHTYRFKLYALDTLLELPSSSTKKEIGQAMNHHILAQTQLEGTYTPI
jgi:Raf kinase inhibitor-like YbhB/YbcL family protein